MDLIKILELVYNLNYYDILFFVKFRSINKTFLKISNNLTSYIPHIDFFKVCDISQFYNLNILNCTNLVSSSNLQLLNNITILNINYCHHIYDDNIKHLKLLRLAARNTNITDNGIKNMNLIYLDASYTKISDLSIINMNLITLIAQGNNNITNIGIKNLPLQYLDIIDNSSITKDITDKLYLIKLYSNWTI